MIKKFSKLPRGQWESYSFEFCWFFVDLLKLNRGWRGVVLRGWDSVELLSRTNINLCSVWSTLLNPDRQHEYFTREPTFSVLTSQNDTMRLVSILFLETSLACLSSNWILLMAKRQCVTEPLLNPPKYFLLPSELNKFNLQAKYWSIDSTCFIYWKLWKGSNWLLD